MDGRVQSMTPEDIRLMIAEDRFGDLIDGQVIAIPHSETLARALALAAECGHIELVHELVREGADLDRAADALIAAADAGRVQVVRLLVTAGVSVDARCAMFGASALMHAAGSGAAEVVAALLALGADPDATDRGGRTARGWAEMGAGSPHWEQWSMPAELEAEFRHVFELLAAAKSKQAEPGAAADGGA